MELIELVGKIVIAMIIISGGIIFTVSNVNYQPKDINDDD